MKRLAPEEALLRQVLALAHARNWAVAHFRSVRIQRRDGSYYYATPVQGDGEGWPDLVLVRDKVLFVELKSDTGRLRPAQTAWLAALRVAGCDVRVWRPRDWDLIEEALR